MSAIAARRAGRCAMKPGDALKQGVLLLASFIALVPTLFMIATALKSDEEYAVNKLGLPDTPVLENFRAVLVDSPFLAWMVNSLILVVGAVLLSTVVSCLAAYAIARMEFKGRDTLLAGQHLADGGAAGRDDRAALRALHPARPDQHLSGRDHHLCRADHALLGLPAHHLLPHRAEGAVRVGAHRRRRGFPDPAARSCCRCRCRRS